MARIILHVDMNNYYASVACLYNPSLRGKPVAVAGDPEQRHGIVLAKSYEAKKYGVQTGDPLWRARKLCKDIIFVPPHYDRYLRLSKQAKEIYYDYTNQIESYGLDECWLDITGDKRGGQAVADEIRERVKNEIGITASVGVSFNKVFAKLGSDMKKPDATTVIDEDNYKEVAWPLPVGDLLFVGHATSGKLHKYGIHTIGNLANTNLKFMENRFGKNGRMLWRFANGLDGSLVSKFNESPPIKSVGNSTTAPRDLVSDEDIKITLGILCESVSARLREYGLICRTVQIGIRYSDLTWVGRQVKLAEPNRTAKSIFEKAYELYKRNAAPNRPVRSLSVKACDLLSPDFEQLTLFGESEVQKREKLETAIDSIHKRYGYFKLRQGNMLTDLQLSRLNPKEDHIVSPGHFTVSV